MSGHDQTEQQRERAYELWEQAGRPEGRHEEFWHQAGEELGGGQGSGVIGVFDTEGTTHGS